MEASEMTDEPNSTALLPYEHGDRLDLESDFATIELRPVSRGDSPRIEARGRHGESVRFEVHRDAGVVHVEVKPDVSTMGAIFFGRRSAARIVAFVPENVIARLSTSAGRLSIARLRNATLEVHADAGSVELDDVSGRIRLTTSAGRIEGRGLSGAISATTDAGSIQLEIAHLDAGRHEITTSVGSIRIELARGLPVLVQARATMGSAKVDVRSTPGAAAVLEVSADLGSVRVRESARHYEGVPSHVQLPAPIEAGPFRTMDRPAPVPKETLDRILARVASGELSPEAASQLLRALGQA
jgi:hypothetical protein